MSQKNNQNRRQNLGPKRERHLALRDGNRRRQPGNYRDTDALNQSRQWQDDLDTGTKR